MCFISLWAKSTNAGFMYCVGLQTVVPDSAQDFTALLHVFFLSYSFSAFVLFHYIICYISKLEPSASFILIPPLSISAYLCCLKLIIEKASSY